MSLFNPLRAVVSLKKRRYIEDGFNLDLTYITDKVIAMGVPAEKMDSLYRNPINEVRKFLDFKHPKRYKIYNLCSERCYSSSRFPTAQIGHYPFDDHNPPPLEMFKPFVQDVISWLSIYDKNVAVIHCKAGKGRTGVMICSYLIASGLVKSADEAIKYYGVARTKNEKGVTIPSQIRYIHYCDVLMQNEWSYIPKILFMKSLTLHTPPQSTSYSSSCDPILMITMRNTIVYDSNADIVFKKPDDSIGIIPGRIVPLSGDVKVECFYRDKFRNLVKLFQFWFNTAFVDPGEAGMYKLVLSKSEVDGAHKDGHQKKFDAEFRVELVLVDLSPPSPQPSEDAAIGNSKRLVEHSPTPASFPPSPLVISQRRSLPLVNRDSWQASQSCLAHLVD